MGAVTRKTDINRRRRRKAKIKRIKAQIAKAKDGNQMQKLVEKLYRVSPFYPLATK